MDWDADHLNAAAKVVQKRFAMNSVAGHFAPPSMVDKMASTVPSNRFDFDQRVVVDNETINLREPFAKCSFTLAQVTEFGALTGAALTGELVMQNRIVTALTRAASALARWHDVLFFVGFQPKQLPSGVVDGNGRAVNQNVPVSLREAAILAEQAELEEKDRGPVVIPRGSALNEGLVAAVFAAVLKLESRGYFSLYHLVLGERLWEELHRPTAGSMVVARERIESTLSGGQILRTTTLPNDEALIASLDGPTFDCVIAGSMDQYPSFEPLPTTVSATETLYQARVVERFAPRVRENQSIVRLQIQTAA